MQVFYGFSFKSGNKKHSQNESACHLKTASLVVLLLLLLIRQRWKCQQLVFGTHSIQP